VPAISLKKTSTVLALICLSVLLKGCLTPNQKPAEAFADGKLPRVLERIANQYYELAGLRGRIVNRTEADAKNKELIRVAVIDNGVDLSHPDLVDRIEFVVKNGQVVAAGFDAMGADRMASPSRIEPQLFSFGAESIVDGKIVGPPESPLELLAKFNKDFMTQLTQKVHAHPVLSKSLFRKMSMENSTLFGLMKESKDFSKGSYDTSVKSETIIIEGQRDKSVKHAFEATVFMVDRQWKMDASSGLPVGSARGYVALSSLEHADVFFELVKSELQEFEKTSNLEKSISTFEKYLLARNQVDANAPNEARRKVLGLLVDALVYKLKGPNVNNPLHTLVELLDRLAVAERGVRGETGVESAEMRQENVRHMANRYIEIQEQMIEIAVARGADSEEKRKDIESVNKIKAVLAPLLRGAIEAQFAPKTDSSSIHSELRRHLIRTTHPYIDGSSQSTSHGSHVSGIISRQSPEIRIVPVRVSTDGTHLPKQTKEKLKETYLLEFERWLSDPSIFRGLEAIVGESFPEIEFKNATDVQRRAAAQKMIEKFGPLLKLSIEGSSLDFAFVEEILRSIEYVGKEKIKIANMSLGMNFNEAVRTFPPNKGETFKSAFEFLKFEFLKYRVAESINKHAPQTLFVVATGNDGAWIDGKTKSGLPFDLSSPYFEQHQNKERNEVLENNRIKNILAVGSLNPRGDYSSFTNIPIGLQVPTVFAAGESVLSPVRTLDSEGLKQFWNRELSALDTLEELGYISELSNEEYKKFGFDVEKMDPTQRREFDLKWLLFRMSMDSMGEGIVKAAQHQFFSEHPTHRARLAGTSMATPAVAGLIAKYTIERAKALNLSPAEVFDHPQFSPEQMIEDVMRRGVPVDPKARGISFRKLMGDLIFEDGRKTQELEVRLRTLREEAEKSKSIPLPFPELARAGSCNRAY
jgi:subtilisin family serine protease